MHFKICRNSCVPNGYIKTRVCDNSCVWYGEYLGCQLFVGPHIPLILRCQVWGVPGLPTCCWTSYSLIFEVPGLGSTWCANFLLDLIFPYFWVARFGEYLVCQLFVGSHIPLFLGCQCGGVPGLPTFCWTSYSLSFEVPGLGSTWCANFLLDLIFPYFWGARFWGVPGLPTFRWISYSPIFGVPGLGNTWCANFLLDLILPYFWGAPHIPLFLGFQVWGVPGVPTFIESHIPLFLMCHIQGFRYCRFLSPIWLDVMLWCSRHL